ncbi:DUF6636 domain-containing protein [Nocardia sp. NPDC023988]|uniref:DUF6636 domain-containing protein n=1 Tax=unclassified Nocardia TaxID=2637762 RepID=UPI0033EA37E2
MRKAFVVAALVASVVSLSACGSTADQGGGSATTSVPGTQTGTPAPRTTVPDRQTAAPTVAPAPDSGSTPGKPIIVPGNGPDNTAPAPAPAGDGFTPVDANKYQLDGGHYFRSPTGNIYCGILTHAPYGVGCQLASTNRISPKLPNCTDAPDRKVAAHLYEGKSELLCTSQGIFVGIPQDGSPAGGAVLNYGQSLTVNGYTCDSSSQGVRCMASGHGFAISADDQHTF